MTKRILVTGATGKVGRHFIAKILGREDFADWRIRALCHHRTLPETDRLEVAKGSISDRDLVREAMEGVTHVLHLATVKETPELIMDVAVKGMFWLLETCRESREFEQFLLVGGDCAVGHFVYPYEEPVTEKSPPRPYPGCYALSKVLEETMLEQFYTMYDLNGCCLRAPWIMEKDDFRCQLSFGEDVFGGPRWCELVTPEEAADYQKRGVVPVMLDEGGNPVKRNFVHVDDLTEAILLALDSPRMRQQLVNVCMDEPADYAEVAAYLGKTRNLDSVGICTPYHSTWLDNTKAKLLLGWRPRYNLERLIDDAWDYQRAADAPRKIWYPG